MSVNSRCSRRFWSRVCRPVTEAPGVEKTDPRIQLQDHGFLPWVQLQHDQTIPAPGRALREISHGSERDLPERNLDLSP